MSQDKEQQQEVWVAAKPFVRSICAFLIYLVRKFTVEDCYKTADKFTTQLNEDIQ